MKRTRIKPVSDKRAAENRQYAKLRAAFLDKHQVCPVTGQPTCDIHHRGQETGTARLDTSQWTAVSRRGHVWIHKHPDQARLMGLLD